MRNLILLFIFIFPFELYAANQSFDLDVGWISRSPEFNFPMETSNPRRDGWPKPGQTVQWTAHIINWGSSNARAVEYRFNLDGRVVQKGAIDVPAGVTTTIDFPWQWEFERHDLKFIIDPENRFKEFTKANNQLTVQSDAISVGFYVERELYGYFHTNQNKLNVGSNSWEDWAQRQITTMNQMFAAAISPEAPFGVLDRWRIDEIKIVENGSLPLQGGAGPGIASRNPNEADLNVDIIWGFPSSLLDGATYKNITSRSPRNPFYIEGGMLHELGHVRYLIDVYLIQIIQDGSRGVIEILEDGHPVVGTNLMPIGSGGIVYKTFERGLMNQDYYKIDRYSSIALNLIAGYRARGLYGNTIFNPVLGSFLHDIPSRNRIRLVDTNGNPIVNAAVSSFKAEEGPLVPGGPFGTQHQIIYRNQPDLAAQTDMNGEFVVQGDPFRKPEYSFLLTGVSIIRVVQSGRTSFLFFEVTAAQRAFWRGHRKEASYELVVDGSPCEKIPSNLRATQKNNLIQLAWEKVPGAYGYVVRASIDRKPWKVLGGVYQPNLELTIQGHKVEWNVEAHFDQCLSSESAKSIVELQ